MAISDELTCQELIELVTAYVEEMLTPAARARFEAHLGICADCQSYLAQMRRTIQLVGRLEEQDIPTEAQEQLLRTFRAWKQSS